MARADGTARASARARQWITICVDCPHWVALTPAQHVSYLTRECAAIAQSLKSTATFFLPEDFGALRQWLYVAAREARDR